MARSDNSRGIRLIALLLALLAGGFAFIWVLTNDLKFDWATPSNQASTSAAAPAGEPLQLRNAPAKMPAEAGTPLISAPEPEVVAPAPEAEPIPEPLHQPDYGELLHRGGASAVFTLRDAQGAMLIDPPERVHLFRNLGKYWHIDQCEYVDGEIRCVGLSGKGLEPGEYELEIDAQRYGRLQHKFRVTRGQKLSGEIRTPYWRRIICLKFVDPDGQPVKWIHRWPRAEQPENGKYARPSYRTPPTGIQHVSPYFHSRHSADGRVELVNEASSRYSGDFDPGPFATDDGRVYAIVFAGARSTLITEFLPSVWGTQGVTLESTFESPEWDEKVVALPPTNLVAAHVEREGAKDWDPGRRSLLEPRALWEYRSEGHGRLVLTFTGPETLVPKYQRAMRGELNSLVDVRDYRPMSREGDQWVAQNEYEDPIALMVTDGETFVVGPELFEVAGQAEKHIVRHFSAVSLPRPTFQLCPTLDTMLIERSCWLYIQGEESTGEPTTSSISMFLQIYDRPGPLLFAESTLQQIIQCQEAVSGLYLESASGPAFFGTEHHSYRHRVWRGTGAELITKLKAGEFRVTCDPAGALIFRAVGDLGEGLPWVQASIVPYEYDRAAATLRELMPDLRADGIGLSQVSMSDRNFRLLEAAREKAAKPGAASESYAQFLPERLAELVTDPAARYWLALNRAWYSMHNQVNTDEHGYGWSEDAGLEPGKLYVLYLWSQSCDDLKPDRRIVFKATEGVTDLGVITLPSYK